VSDILKRLPWLITIVVVLWYSLYGWSLSTTISPPLYWLVAAAIALSLSAAIISAFLLAVPVTLALSYLVAAPLALNAAIFKGNEQVFGLANTFSTRPTLFFALALILALFWFSPLFWSKRQMAERGFSRNQTFWILTTFSWVGLGLGWLIGRFY
jgi:hypothetical protein